MPWLLYIFSDFLRLVMSLLLLNVTLREYLIRIAYCLFFIRTTISVWLSSKFGQIRPQTAEFAALERLKNQCIMLSTL